MIRISSLLIFALYSLLTLAQNTSYYNFINTNFKEEIDQVELSPTGAYIVIRQDSDIEIRSSEDFRLIKKWDLEIEYDPLASVHFSHDDTLILQYGYLDKYDSQLEAHSQQFSIAWKDSKKPVVTLNNTHFQSLRSHNKKVIANRGLGSFSLTYIDDNTNIQPINFDSSKGVFKMRFSHDSRWLAYAHQDSNILHLYDLQNKKEVWRLVAPKDESIETFAFSDDNLVVVHSCFLRMLSLETYEQSMGLCTYGMYDDVIDQIKDLVYLPNIDKWLAVGLSFENTPFVLLDLEQYKVIDEKQKVNENLVGTAGNELRLVTQDWHDNINSYRTFIQEAGNTLITQSENELYVWNTQDYRRIANYSLADEIGSSSLSSDGKFLFVQRQGPDAALHIVNLEDQSEQKLEKNYKEILFQISQFASYKSQYLLFYGMGKFHLYNLHQNRIIKSIGTIPSSYRNSPTMLPFISNIGDSSEVLLFHSDEMLILFDLVTSSIMKSVPISSDDKIFQQSPEVIFKNQANKLYQLNLNTLEFEVIAQSKRKNKIESAHIKDQQLIYSYSNEKVNGYVVKNLLDNNETAVLLDTARGYNAMHLVQLASNANYLLISENAMQIVRIKDGKVLKRIRPISGRYGNGQMAYQISKEGHEIQTGVGIIDLKKAEFYSPDLETAKIHLDQDTYIKLVVFDWLSDDERSGLLILNKQGDTTRTKTTKKYRSLHNLWLSPDKKFAVCLGTDQDYESHLLFWDLERFKLITAVKSGIISLQMDALWVNGAFVFKDNKDQFAYDYKTNFSAFDIKSQRIKKWKKLPVDIMNAYGTGPEPKSVCFGNKALHLYKHESKTTDSNLLYLPSSLEIITYSAQRNELALGLENGEILIYNHNDLSLKHRLWSHSGSIEQLVYDGNELISSAADNAIKIWDMELVELKMTFYQYFEFKNGKMSDVKDNRYCFITPDNYYKASKDMDDFLHFVEGKQVYGFEQFDLQFNRPDIVLKSLGYADQSLVEAYYVAYNKRLKRNGLDPENQILKAQLPKLVVTNKASLPLSTDSESVHIEFMATDSFAQLTRLHVTVNDVAIYGKNGQSLLAESHTLKTAIDIPLTKGENKIDILVQNDLGIKSYTSSLTVDCEIGKDTPDLYILTIGVSTYLDSSYNLRYAAKDAQDIADVFQNSKVYGNVFSQVWTNEKVIKSNLAAMKAFLAQADINDQVMVFIAGHGILDDSMNYYFASHDVDFENPGPKGISYEEIEAMLDGIACLKKLLFMDTCHSGELDEEDVLIGERDSAKMLLAGVKPRGIRMQVIGSKEKSLGLANTSSLMKSMFTDLQKGTGATVISAAGGMEYALESNKWQNGLFTYCLLDALDWSHADTDLNGIYVSELHDYVSKKVVELSHGRQQPTSRKVNAKMDVRIW